VLSRNSALVLYVRPPPGPKGRNLIRVNLDRLAWWCHDNVTQMRGVFLRCF
jgi:hypothetical protein